ncbi:S-methyl-5-thioribose-1-phosphate isomerase [bacterium]|nr:MAG: S-methyl-5-thioribose-1-phosphate isomerase [bacterium]
MKFKTVEWMDGKIRILDQTLLPLEEKYLELETPGEVGRAIKEMKVRGAPLIGIVAAYGVALAWVKKLDVERAIEELRKTRPTAYNLFYALDRMKKAYREGKDLVEEALSIHKEDEEICRKIGEYGFSLLSGDEITGMTICNAGALATGGMGTALAPFYVAKEKGKKVRVFVPETRPFLQGARLTAWELSRNGIEVYLVSDGAKAHILRTEKVDIVITGADRIAMNGDAANKIGTLGLAVCANEFGVPFYIAAPHTTFDPGIKSGDEIPIEERSPDEVFYCGGTRIAPEGIGARNPVFDVTPEKYIHGFITDAGIIKKPYDKNIPSLIMPLLRGRG